MTLDEYIAKAKEELESLRRHYKVNAESDPGNWPMEMDEDDWTDQEIAYRFN